MQAPNNVPASLRTGRGHVSASSQPQQRAAAALVMGEAASPCTWRGLTRLALVSLVAAEEPVATEPAPLAETLSLDARTSFHPSLLCLTCAHSSVSWIARSRLLSTGSPRTMQGPVDRQRLGSETAPLAQRCKM